MLSTHLIEEVSGFIGRAVLIHKGQIIGDKKSSELDDEGLDLMDYIKKTYNYRADRVAKALQELEAESDHDRSGNVQPEDETAVTEEAGS